MVAEAERRVGEPGWSSDERSVSVWFADPHERAGGLYCGQAEFPDDGALRGRRSFSNPHSRAAPPTQESPWTLKRRSGHHLSPGDRVVWRVWWQPEGGRCVESRTTTREVETRVGHRPALFENAEAGLVQYAGRDDVFWSFTRHRLADRDPASPGDQRAVCIRLVGHDVAPNLGTFSHAGGHPCAAFTVPEGGTRLGFSYTAARTLTPGAAYRVWVVECLGFLGGQCADWAPWRDAHKSTPPLKVPLERRVLPLFYGAAVELEQRSDREVVTWGFRSHRLTDRDPAPGDQILFCVRLVGHDHHAASGGTAQTVHGHKCAQHGGGTLREDRDQAGSFGATYVASGRLTPGATYPVWVAPCLAIAGACQEWATWDNAYKGTPDLKVPPPPEPPPLFTNLRVEVPTVLATTGGVRQFWWRLTWDSFNRDRLTVDGVAQNERFCLRVFGPDPTSAETLAWAPMTLLDTLGDAAGAKTAAHGRVCYAREWRDAHNDGGEQRVRWRGPYLGWPTRRDSVGQPNIDVSMLIPGSWLFEVLRCLSPVPKGDWSAETLKTGHCGKWGAWDDASSFRWPPERSP